MKKENKRSRLRAGDWILLLLALVGIGLGAWYFQGKRQEPESVISVTYSIQVPVTKTAWLPSPDAWQGGVTDESGRRDLGTVVEVVLRPHKTLAVKDGEVVSAEIPDCVVPVITVRAEARLIGGIELRIGELRLAAGMTGDFIIGGFLAKNARILWVEVTG